MKAAVPGLLFKDRRNAERIRFRASHLVLAISLGLAYGTYFTLRYLGYWSENDTAVLSLAAKLLGDAERIQYSGAYSNGYAYSIWGATLSALTGLSVGDFVQLYTPLLGNLLLATFGYATFRRLLASDHLGLLAASVLFLVPEMVFTVSRGSHEKLTVALTLMALLALLNSFLALLTARRWQIYAAWVAVFYFSIFTSVTLNTFLGSSLILACTLTLVFAFLLLGLRRLQMFFGRVRRRPSIQARRVSIWGEVNNIRLAAVIRRLLYIVCTSWLLAVLVSWYIYPTANYSDLAQTAYERLSQLLFSDAPTASEPTTFEVANPYSVIGSDWLSAKAYRVISSFRWALFLGSFVTWLLLLARLLRGPKTDLHRLFLVALYGAFGFELALAVPIDFLNLHAGTNLQVRIYTYFALLAAPVFALGLSHLFSVQPKARAVLVPLMQLCLLGFAGVGLFKATLDPGVSNRWLFYHPAEVQALGFFDGYLQSNSIWVGTESRLRDAYITTYLRPPENVLNLSRDGGPSSPYALNSPIIRENTEAWGAQPSALWLENQVYDNGETQLFHQVPRTLFQR